MPSESPHAICGAKTRSGEPCKQPRMPNGRCRMHGGKSLIGIASPTFKEGRYSKSIPTRLAGKYEEAVADRNILDLKPDVALLDSRLSDLLEAVSNGEAGEMWKRLKDALREYDKAGGKDVEAQRAEAFGNIRWLVNEGYQEYMSWNEIRSILEDRRRLVDSERQRLKDAQKMIDAKELMALLNVITDSVRRNVTDPAAIRAIAADIERIVLAGGRQEPDAA